MTTIIACTDGSELAEQGITAALPLLVTPGDRIVLTTVVDTLPSGLGAPAAELGAQPGLTPPFSPSHMEDMIATVLAQGEKLLAETASRLKLPEAERRVLDGKPGPEIRELAKELDADVIVVAQRGKGVIRRALMGSVSTYVVRHAHCPVLVVPSKAASG